MPGQYRPHMELLKLWKPQQSESRGLYLVKGSRVSWFLQSLYGGWEGDELLMWIQGGINQPAKIYDICWKPTRFPLVEQKNRKPKSQRDKNKKREKIWDTWCCDVGNL